MGIIKPDTYFLCAQADGYGFKKGGKKRAHHRTGKFPRGFALSDLQCILAVATWDRVPGRSGEAHLRPAASAAFSCIAQLVEALSSFSVHLRCHFFLSSPFRTNCCCRWHPQHSTSISSARCQFQAPGLAWELATYLPAHRKLLEGRGHLLPIRLPHSVCMRQELTHHLLDL